MGHKRYELYLCGAIQILITMPGPHCVVKVYTRCIPVQLFASNSAGETRLSSFCAVWGVALRLDLSALPSPAAAPVQSLSHEKLTWNHLHTGPILASDWPGESSLPQGAPTNGDSAAWLIGRGQVAPLHFSFFCFKQQPLHCLFFLLLLLHHLLLLLSSFVLLPWERGVGPERWSTPSDSFVPSWMQCGLYPHFDFPCLFFSWFSLVTEINRLFGYNYGHCQPSVGYLRLVMNHSPPLCTWRFLFVEQLTGCCSYKRFTWLHCV